MNDQLKAELEQMHGSDQEHRKLMWGVVQQHGRDSSQFRELAAKQKKIDAKNIERLVEIIEQHGWPGHSLVGETASNGAFLVLQHAELTLQERFLPLLRRAKDAGELRRQSLALLEDRVLMRQGKNQIYGSQLTTDSEGRSEPWPIEDEANVDQRRAEVGLEPLADYLKRFGLEYAPKASP